MKLKQIFGLASFVALAFGMTVSIAQVPQQRRPVKKVRHAVQLESRDVLAEGSDVDRKMPGGGRETSRRGASRGIVAPVAGSRAQIPSFGKPQEGKLERSSKTFDGDLRDLPTDPQPYMERPEKEGPNFPPITLGGSSKAISSRQSARTIGGILAPAPSPVFTFNGLSRADVGNGYPPDTNGDVGPTYYIQTINTGIGVYDKTTGAAVVGPVSFNTFMSLGAFGNICDTNNFGDPVVLYDSFEDRWIITDFAFTLSGGAVTSPSLQCFAVSKTGDPVTGGWYYYSIQSADLLGDYPKFGVWTDGIYMTANMFGKGALTGSFAFSREWAFNKLQMYAGSVGPQIVTFDAPRLDVNGGTVFTIVPSNARLQTGTPPAGTPNYFLGLGTYTNAIAAWKFHVDWTNVFNSTFTGVNTAGTGFAWVAPPATVPALGGNALDTLATRTMMQNQYTNIGGVESIWGTHTVRNSTTAGFAVPRWYQLDVTGGTIAANTTQAANHEPDNTVNRWMGSLALDRLGDMLIGYSASNSAIKPGIRWAGRLAADPVSTLPQTEVDMIAGTGAQTNTCGGVACTRWGDYSSMSLDPVDGCTFWYTSEYYAVDGSTYLTRIGQTKFPGCAVVLPGSVTGTVTDGANPISGATVSLGSRTTTTAVNGSYSFSAIPAGTYLSITASAPGKNASTNSNVVVPGGGSSTQDFTLAAAPTSACSTDTSQADFSTGLSAKVDLVTSAGDATLSRQNLDQYNLSYGGSGVGITITTWGGQTFTPSVSGQLTRADINLFCSGCTGTTPNLTVSVRATAANVPTGADLATGTITGFSSGTAQFYTVNFASPLTLTVGTKYALAVRPTSNPSVGTYAFTRTGSGTVGEDLYSGGDRVSSIDTGTTWTINATGGVVTDGAFRTFMTTPSGTFVSSIKDANPPTGFGVSWDTLSWNGTTPASTTLRFQVAASNSVNGPFNFVGPDTTAGTYFTTSPASFTQFNGNRYLRYKAFLDSTDPAATPTLADATVCYTNSAPTAAEVSVSGRVATADGTGIRGATVTMTDPRGVARTAISNAFGYYTFESIPSGATYVMRASARRYIFSARAVHVSDTLTDVDFVDGQ